jgi:uncharacterized delta-60 repeat protein
MLGYVVGGGKRGVVLLVAIVWAAAGPAAEAGATSDTAGNRSGHTTFRFPHQHVEASDVAVQDSGQIVLAGTAYTRRSARFALVRTLSSGRLDLSFGDRGRVTTDFGGRSQLLAIANQPDGKFVAAGYTAGADGRPRDFLIARYMADGSLDSTFGAAGSVRVDLGGADYASSLQIDGDGRIVVGGGSDRGDPSAQDFESRLAITRLKPNGALDPGFGDSGTASAGFGGFNLALAVTTLPDGDVSIAGSHTPDPSALPQDSLAIARFSSTGSPDTAFGNGGTLTRELTTRREGGRVRDVQPLLGAVEFAANGSIVAATEVAIYTRRKLKYEAWLARFRSDGTLDPGFGTGGYTSVGERTLFTPGAVSVQADGAIYMAGHRFGRRNMSLALTHLQTRGGLDRGFGRRGRVGIPFPGSSSYASALATDASGHVVVAGSAIGRFSAHTGLPVKPARIAVARYTAGGRLDRTFGSPSGNDKGR